MSKKTGLIIVFFLVIFIVLRVNFALNFQQNTPQTADFTPELPSAFTGIMPCASCPGIEYELRLEESHSFTEFSRYIDRDSDNFVYTGRWAVTGDTLSLHFDHSDDKKQFLFSDDTLQKLDSDGNTITDEMDSFSDLLLNREFQSILNRHRELRKQGVTFVASGNEPFWSYNILENQSLKFSAPGEDREAKSVQIDKGEDKFELVAELSGGLILESSVEEGYCQDSMSGFRFTHNVTITLDGETHPGCGRYLR